MTLSESGCLAQSHEMSGDQATIWQKCARLISGNLWGLPPSTDSTDTGFTLSNDQKFADFELRLTGIASQYSHHGVLDEVLQAQENIAADKLLRVADAMIPGDILKQRTPVGGRYSKIIQLTQMTDAEQAIFVKTLRPANVQPREMMRVATEYNKTMERLSESPLDSAHQKLHPVGVKPANTISYARQFREGSQKFWNMLLPSSSCCTTTSSHHSAKIELVPSGSRTDNKARPFHVFVCSRSDKHPSTWHELRLNAQE